MTNSTQTSSIVDSLRTRYATKQFDPAKKIPAETFKLLEEALILSPSSFGLQPYKFVVVTDQTVKERLVNACWNQRQPADCSHFVIFCRLDRIDENTVTRYVERVASVRAVPVTSQDNYKHMMLGFVSGKTQEELAYWAAKQVYIALGNLMTVASSLEIDNCPMEGIVPDQVDELLGLKAHGITSLVACALGYRAADDKYAALTKVRFPAEELIVNI